MALLWLTQKNRHGVYKSPWSVNTLTSDGARYIHARPWLELCTSKRMLIQHETRCSTRIKQPKQSLLKETRLTSAVTRKTQKSTVANKYTETASKDTCVHSSRSEDAAVGECGKRTKTTDQPLAKQKSKVLNVKEHKSLQDSCAHHCPQSNCFLCSKRHEQFRYAWR